ncbi:MAG: phospho-N-acetylmuramoyl-pentapeptide-transferase [Actinobacteria bacterium RBG_16_64_13]|nr:MAG: phospho-N-acetylmuramoyl-pentapeptide-transferase [Actinobacteria bacterium RBG_16_64_13]
MAAGPRFIRWLSRRGIGQNIRELTPESHIAKQGTPTMGGLLILVAALIPYLIFGTRTVSALVVVILAFGSGAIGFADDLTSQWRQRSLGLSARVKLLLQVPLVAVAVFLALRYGGVDAKLSVPFVRDGLDIGWLYYPFAFLLIAGFSNAVNLTDGLDGLAAGTGAVTLFAYAGIAFLRGETDLATLAACMTGASVGFLWYNSHPAAVFMGDTGSLALGAGLAGMAIVTNMEILLLLVGGVFVVEALSVIIQVFSFRVFHRRVFLMAPIHHHFELKGWSETKIIVRFWIIAAILAAAGFALYYLSNTRLPTG